jgi:hypothetical protein
MAIRSSDKLHTVHVRHVRIRKIKPTGLSCGMGERFVSVASLKDTADRNFSLLRHSLQNLADCCRIINE